MLGYADDHTVVADGTGVRVPAYLCDGVPTTTRIVDAAGRPAGSRPGFLYDADDAETQARIAYDQRSARMPHGRPEIFNTDQGSQFTDLFLRAKHLFSLRLMAGVHRGLRRIGRSRRRGWSRSEPVQFSRDQQSKAPDAAAEGKGPTGSEAHRLTVAAPNAHWGKRKLNRDQ